MAETTDKKVLDLIAQVKKQKKEILQAERPNWLTNCSFSYSEGRQNDAVNLHVASDVRQLVLIAAFLTEKSVGYTAAAKTLGVDAPSFTWQGFSVADWLSDIKSRIAKIQISSKKQKLEVLESRLDKIISPELRAQMELEAIESELNG